MTNGKIHGAAWPKTVFYVIVACAILVGSFVLSRSQLDTSQFKELGYIGVFLATLIGSATLFFPVPNIATVIAGGILFNPIGVTVAAGLGSTLGEIVGYTVGRSGHSAFQETKWHSKVFEWFSRFGGLTIFLLALVPNPLFDLAGVVAGMANYSVLKFVLATFLGKTLRALILSLLGSQLS